MLQNPAWVKDTFRVKGRPATNLWNIYQYGFRFYTVTDF